MRGTPGTGAALLVAALALHACGVGGEPVTLDFQPSIVLITSDSLRRDHLGCYGYFRPTSPRLDEFARDSVVFERAVASMATTLPSHLTMLTGLYAHQHGMSSNHRATTHPYRSAPGRESLAEVLSAAGYETAAFVSSAPLARDTGIAAGFETYSQPEKRFRKGKKTVREAIAWLDARVPGRPFFLWVHLWEPHDPNRPSEEYASLFDGGPQLEAWVDELGIDPAAVQRAFAGAPSIAERFLEEGGPIDRAHILDLFDRYDADVRYVDDCAGDLLDALAERGWMERSIVAFTGDHGQALGEHAWLGHARIVDVNVLVPLLVRFPAGLERSRRVPELVSLADLAPTLLARVPGDFGAFLAQAEGEDVLAPDFERPFVLTQQTDRDLHLPAESGMRFALLEGHWKLVEEPGRPPRLHDLADGGEARDVAVDHPDVVQALRARMQSVLSRRPYVSTEAERTGPTADGLMEALRELGYVE